MAAASHGKKMKLKGHRSRLNSKGHGNRVAATVVWLCMRCAAAVIMGLHVKMTAHGCFVMLQILTYFVAFIFALLYTSCLSV